MDNIMDGKVSLSMEEINHRMLSFVFPAVDLVVGITTGATFLAGKIAEHLNLPVLYIHINFRLPDNTPKFANPQLIKMEHIPPQYKRLLLVDDVSVTGKTLNCAIENLKNFTVFTFVIKGKADYVLFPEISGCIEWPWKTEGNG